MEQLAVLLSSLSLSQDRLAVLENVRPALSRLSRQELTTGLTDVNLVPIFDCLNSGQEDLERSGCEVLSRLLAALDPAIVLDRYSSFMSRGLIHTSPRVQSLVLSQRARCSQDEDLATQLIKKDLLPACLECISGDLRVATEVTSMVVSLAETSIGLATITGPFVPKQLIELMGRSSVIQLRVLELVVHICVLSCSHLEKMISCQLLSPLMSLLKTEDCLSTLAAIEILTTMALPTHGQRYLDSSGIMAQMSRLLEDSHNHPFASILLPGLVKFFGNLAHSRPRQILVQYPTFVSSLVSMAESDDMVSQSIAFETVGYIGVSLEGKAALAELGNKMTNCIDRLETLITDSTTETRIRAMNAFASLIKLDKENQSPELLSFTESWYRRVPSTMRQLASIVKQPFLDLRLAAYQLLQVLCGQPWGRLEVLRWPGMVENLLDRTIEREKEGKEEKFRVMESLVDSGVVQEVVGEQLDMQCRLYVKQGPNFVQVQSQVATEGE